MSGTWRRETAPLEDEKQREAHIKYIHSHSYYGSSITNIYPQDGVEVGRAEADITAIAQTVVKALPPESSS